MEFNQDDRRRSVSTACNILDVLVGPEISEEIVESLGLKEERQKRLRELSEASKGNSTPTPPRADSSRAARTPLL